MIPPPMTTTSAEAGGWGEVAMCCNGGDMMRFAPGFKAARKSQRRS
jgi:hypothetical protein